MGKHGKVEPTRETLRRDVRLIAQGANLSVLCGLLFVGYTMTDSVIAMNGATRISAPLAQTESFTCGFKFRRTCYWPTFAIDYQGTKKLLTDNISFLYYDQARWIGSPYEVYYSPKSDKVRLAEDLDFERSIYLWIDGAATAQIAANVYIVANRRRREKDSTLRELRQTSTSQ